MDKDKNSHKSADKKSSASGNSTSSGQADSNPLLDAAFGKFFFSFIFLKSSVKCRQPT